MLLFAIVVCFGAAQKAAGEEHVLAYNHLYIAKTIRDFNVARRIVNPTEPSLIGISENVLISNTPIGNELFRSFANCVEMICEIYSHWTKISWRIPRFTGSDGGQVNVDWCTALKISRWGQRFNHGHQDDRIMYQCWAFPVVTKIEECSREKIRELAQFAIDFVRSRLIIDDTIQIPSFNQEVWPIRSERELGNSKAPDQEKRLKGGDGYLQKPDKDEAPSIDRELPSIECEKSIEFQRLVGLALVIIGFVIQIGGFFLFNRGRWFIGGVVMLIALGISFYGMAGDLFFCLACHHA